MSANEATKFQVNFKTNAGTLINVYGETVLDAISTMNEMAAAIDLIRKIEATLNGATAPAPVAVAPAAVQPTSETAAPAAAPAGHVCRHGAMVYKTGTSQKTGREWKAWMCPSPNRADQCEPEFIR